MLQDVPLKQRYDITGVPQYFLIGSAQISRVAPKDNAEVQTPNPLRGLATA